jgi:hypothetical protein
MVNEQEIAQQQTLLNIHRQTLAYYLERQALLGAAHVPPEVFHGIAAARAEIGRIKLILRGWGADINDHPDDESAVSAQDTPAAAASVDRIKLRQILTDNFADDELRDLCFELGIDYENLGGTGKSGKARELVAFAERRGRFVELVNACRRLRSNAPW